MTKNKVIKIGVTLDYCEDESYAKTPWYALRANYVQALAERGVVVQLLHYEYPDLQILLSEINGLVITGGNFDIDPALYDQTIANPHVTLKAKRSQFEFNLCKQAIALKLPILGICGGQQLINVVMGGSLIQHIPDEVPGCLEHEQKTPKHLPSHSISILPETRLYDIVGEPIIQVNSSHHQAVQKVADHLIVNAQAPDGVIEGIEIDDPEHYIMGVQWHPEYCYSPSDKKIIDSFVAACRK